MSTTAAVRRSERRKQTESFPEDRNVDPRTCKREVPMEILDLSMVHTGNTSLQRALEILGYGPACDSFSVFMHAQDVDMWMDGLRKKFSSTPADTTVLGRKEFDGLLGKYEVLSDWPVIAFSPELIAAYPKAKVILVERDIDEWFVSFDKAVISDLFGTASKIISVLDIPLSRFTGLSKEIARGWFGAESAEELRANAKQVHREHYETVRKVTPPERLLNFRLEQGWEPLCAFLGQEVPDCAFPVLDEEVELQNKSDIMIALAAQRASKRFSPWVGSFMILLVAIWFFRR